MKFGLPSEQVGLVLDHEAPGLYGELGYLGELSVRVSNAAVSLERSTVVRSPFLQGDSQWIYPEAGLCLNGEGCLSAHGVRRRACREDWAWLEFDCVDMDGDLAFGAPVGSHEGQDLLDLMQVYGTATATMGELDGERQRVRDARKMCKCCVAQAEQRAQYPKQHPLFGIFELARVGGQVLQFRYPGKYIDLQAEMLPETIGAIDGWIYVEGLETMVSVNTYYLHALALRPTVVDGESYAELHVYDSHGRIFLEVRANPNALSLWQAVCESECRDW